MRPTCAGATGRVSLSQRHALPQSMSPRMWALIRYILELDPELRHTLILNCRGPEPWEIETHVEKRKIELKPPDRS